MHSRIKFRKLFPVLLTVSFSLCLSGCKSNIETVTTDFFVFELNHKEKHATALELTELGKEQEVLVIPQIVEYLPVQHIGKGVKYLNPYKMNALKLTANQKKIYLPYTLNGKIWLTTDTTVEAILTLGNLDNFDKTYIINSFLEIELYYLGVNTKLNTFFMFNFNNAENEGYYWMDYINGSNPYIIPSDPVREGYSFSGWYYEEGCTNIWDNQVPTNESEKLTLYARWV